MKKLSSFFALTLICTGMVSHASYEEGEERPKLPALVGDRIVTRGSVTHRTYVVLDDKNTVYLLTVVGASNTNYFRISKQGGVKEMVMYRGWPYILDNHHRIYTLDTSFFASLKNKLPFITTRMIKKVPMALGTGIGVTTVGLIDQAFFNVMNSRNFDMATVFLGGILAYYGIDTGYTVFFKSHRAIGRGGNFFTRLVAKGVDRIEENPDFDDFQLVTERRSQVTVQHLSTLIPQSLRGNSCADYLTKLSIP